MDGLLLASILVGGCIVLAALSIGVGILVGRRLDRLVEARAAGQGPETREEESSHD